jgi:two-component system sensor histidine kinase YesM
LRLRARLYYSFVSIILVLSVFVFTGIYFNMWSSYLEQTKIALENQAKQLALNIDNRTDYFRSYASLLASDKRLIAALEADNTAAMESVLATETNRLIDLNIARIHEVRLYRIPMEKSSALRPDIYELLRNFPAGIDYTWSYTYLTNRNEKVFSLIQKVFQTNKKYNYCIEICIYETELLSFFNEDQLDLKISVVNHGRLMSFSGRESFSRALLMQRASYQGVAYVQNPDNANTISIVVPCQNGWEICISNDIKYILQGYWAGFRGNIPVVLIVIAIASLTVFSLSNWLTKRMNILHQKIEVLGRWRLSESLKIEGGDEITDLSVVLDKTRELIMEMATEIETNNQLKRRAEMTALRAQINSHFLFNALSTIKWLARKNDQSNLINGVEKLSYILRYALSLSEDFVPLSSEIRYLHAYVYLEKLRYFHAVNVNIDIDAALLDNKTVKFILQPLVENSIEHGKKENGEELNITIYTECDDEYFYLVVEDDGKGIAQKKIEELSHQGPKLETSEYGLVNVINRINWCTRGRGSLVIESKLACYTKIVIKQAREIYVAPTNLEGGKQGD